MKEIKKRSGCPVSFSLDFIGDKWTLLILRDMMLAGKSTYGEFLSSEEKIATNILADRLSMLETHGFLTKQVAEDKKSKFTYSMTEKAIDLVPILLELISWGAKYNGRGDINILQEFEFDKTGTIAKFQHKLRKAMVPAS